MAFYSGIGLDRHEAEDLAAETAEAVVTGIGRLRAPQAFEAWFWSVARNRVRTLFRRRKTVAPSEAMISPATPEEKAIERDEHRQIWSALSKLSMKDRQLLWLREVEGLEYSEIGSRLGSSPATIRVACHRARQRLEAFYLLDE
jgi:RNA polymerase sigma-70 factor (ECF subfamily)